MKKFERSEHTIRKQILIDAIESEVIRDATLYCYYDGHVYYQPEYHEEYRVQFPNHLREKGKKYIADIYKRTTKSGTVFWSAYKGTIRETNGKIIG
jgi:hypothetical protein